MNSYSNSFILNYNITETQLNSKAKEYIKEQMRTIDTLKKFDGIERKARRYFRWMLCSIAVAFVVAVILSSFPTLSELAFLETQSQISFKWVNLVWIAVPILIFLFQISLVVLSKNNLKNLQEYGKNG